MQQHIKNTSVKEMVQLALLTALAAILFIIELSIPNPIPIPGIKIGLANIITIYALYHYNFLQVFSVVFSRIIIGGIFGGNLFSIAFSLSGAVLCLIGMFFISKIVERKYICLCSVVGAILHNIGQIVIAILVTNSISILYYFPYLMISGCIAGMATGICAQIIVNRKLE